MQRKVIVAGSHGVIGRAAAVQLTNTDYIFESLFRRLREDRIIPPLL